MSTSPSADPLADSEGPRRWSARVAGALTHRNFRLLWLAALGSTIGTWMQKYAQGLLVYDLTESTFYLGLDDFLSQLPILLFMLIGGVIADRHDRRRLLTGSQYVQAFAAFFHEMLARGVYLPPSSFEAWFVSAAIGDAELEAIAKALPHAALAARRARAAQRVRRTEAGTEQTP